MVELRNPEHARRVLEQIERSGFALRASSMPLAFRCAASIRRSELRINGTHDAADLGTAVHVALRPLAERGSIDWDALPAIAARYGVSLDDVRTLAAIGAKLWPKIAASFPNAMTEVELSAEILPGITLTGHADLLSITEPVARFGDWKTGRKDSDHSEQMRAYGVLGLLDWPELEEVTVTVIWLREQEIENYTLRRADVAPWIGRVRSEIAEWDGTYRTGSHCPHCPRSHECEAHNALIRRDVAVIADKSLVVRAESELATMAPAEIVSLYEKAQIVEAYAKRVRDAVKLHVQQNGDIVGDGQRLTVETEKRRELDPLKAWPVLEAQGFTDDDFAECVDLRISKVEKRVAAKAGRGKGAAAVRIVKSALDAADAVAFNETQKLKLKRA